MTKSKPNFYFISGLPRSGSTLLAAILRQNPKFHASMSSGLGALIGGSMQIMSPGSEVALTLQEGQRETILRSLFFSYYQDICDKPIIFDTNRNWTSRMPLLQGLFPKSKVIACVRNVSWVMDSLERQVRKNPYHYTRLFDAASQSNVYSRMESLMQPNSLVGQAWSGIKEAFYGEQADSLLIVDYELLARAPEKVLKLIYQFIEEPWYQGHNFEQVEYQADSFDEALGIEGLHTVRPKVEFQPRKTILPPDIFNKFNKMDFWKDTDGSKANVIIPQQSDSE
ncbi:MAG: sulfotransferase [gamma proteobacterium symbiont of Taylorina sp.]|nr:sulfotransferase [gamma proteobacterium symbiont of Taylorina sp.]